MTRIRRTQHVLFQPVTSSELDPHALLRGQLPPPDDAYAFGLLTGRRHQLTHEQFALLMSIPRWWAAAGDAAPDLIAEWIRLGLLITDDPAPEPAALRARDEALTAAAWDRTAAAFHFMTQWSAIDIRGDVERLELGPESREAGRAWVEAHGPPPEPFPPPRSERTVALPPGERSGALYDALLARRTTRAFATGEPMRAEDLATVLRYVFGAFGEARNVAGIRLLKRTSPSGGSMHPIEAYPLVVDVTGIDPGVYHYDARAHRLEHVTALGSDPRATVTGLLAGQDYFGDAHVSIALVARFDRNHWKYREHGKAYPGILMDAAHLSQTLYLVATEIGLGAYVTLAINGRELEELLALDGIDEGVVAVSGCGVRASGSSPLELDFQPLARAR